MQVPNCRHRSGKVTRHQGPLLAAQFMYLPDSAESSKLDYIASWQKDNQVLDLDQIVQDGDILVHNATETQDPHYIPCSNLDDELEPHDGPAATRQMLSKVVVDIQEPGQLVKEQEKNKEVSSTLTAVRFSCMRGQQIPVQTNTIIGETPERIEQSQRSLQYEMTDSYQVWSLRKDQDRETGTHTGTGHRDASILDEMLHKEIYQSPVVQEHSDTDDLQLQGMTVTPRGTEPKLVSVQRDLYLRNAKAVPRHSDSHQRNLQTAVTSRYIAGGKVQVMVVEDDSSIASGELVTNLDEVSMTSECAEKSHENDDGKDILYTEETDLSKRQAMENIGQHLNPAGFRLLDGHGVNREIEQEKQDSRDITVVQVDQLEIDPDYPSSESGQVELTNIPADRSPLKWAYYSAKNPQTREPPVIQRKKKKKNIKSALKNHSKRKLFGKLLPKPKAEKAVSFIEDSNDGSMEPNRASSLAEENNRVPYVTHLQLKEDKASEHSSDTHSTRKLRRTTLFNDSSSKTCYSQPDGPMPMRLPRQDQFVYKRQQNQPAKIISLTEWKSASKVSVEQSDVKQFKSGSVPGISVQQKSRHSENEKKPTAVLERTKATGHRSVSKESSIVFDTVNCLQKTVSQQTSGEFEVIAGQCTFQSKETSSALSQAKPDQQEPIFQQSPAVFQAMPHQQKPVFKQTSSVFQAVPHRDKAISKDSSAAAVFQAVPHQHETIYKQTFFSASELVPSQNEPVSKQTSAVFQARPEQRKSNSKKIPAVLQKVADHSEPRHKTLAELQIVSESEGTSKVDAETALAAASKEASVKYNMVDNLDDLAHDPLYHSISRTNPEGTHTNQTASDNKDTTAERPDDVVVKKVTQEKLSWTMLDHATDNDTEGIGCCGWILLVCSGIVIFLTMPISLCLCIKVVQEYERAVIFRLGRLVAGGAKGPGLFFIVPCMDNYLKVDLRTVSFDVPPQEVLSKDSVTVAVDAVVYYRISNATISVTNVEDANRSTRLLAATTLRNVLGTKNLSEILSDRENISHMMQTSLDEATDPWGVKVERVEVKDVRLPVQLQRAMAAEAEAAREARAKVIAAEGEQKASRALKEAADIMNESPSALQLRYLQTLNTISAEKNSTIIFPIPIDMMQSLIKK